MPVNQLSPHISGPIALPFGGLINMTFGDRELTVAIPSSSPLPAQDPFLFPNGLIRVLPSSAPRLQAWVPLLPAGSVLLRIPPELSPLTGSYATLGISALPEAGAGAEPRKQREKTRGHGISEICSFSSSPSQFGPMQGTPHCCSDTSLTPSC
uniref:Uncharacterized protein n=1 Tax=Myotis myotis TaxID=51298 RepID=A0A7J7VID5_MYOMY|nr:hypothetical protein mMyoMyo1_008244 [Myotis myotis]